GARADASRHLDHGDELAPDGARDCGGVELASVRDEVVGAAGDPDGEPAIRLLEAAVAVRVRRLAPPLDGPRGPRPEAGRSGVRLATFTRVGSGRVIVSSPASAKLFKRRRSRPREWTAPSRLRPGASAAGMRRDPRRIRRTLASHPASSAVGRL